MMIYPDNCHLQYEGRIDFDEPLTPEFVYPCSYVKIRFIGRSAAVIIINRKACWNNYIGFILDGVQGKILINSEEKNSFIIAENIENAEHELMLFKRMDSCHTFRFCGFELSNGAEVLPCAALPGKRIEVYGDSISAGEVSEAVRFAGRPDPDHNGEYSNSYYSYAWMLARKLEARLHCIAQGGIALMDGAGWFSPPNYKGIESIYDKIQFHPDLGPSKKWDFRKYSPHIVIIEIGHNDNHPVDYFAENVNSAKWIEWKSHYKGFVENIRSVHPHALIILKTSIVKHYPSLDMAIDEVCKITGDDRIYHFMYKRNGQATAGHVRVMEADGMSDELQIFINSLGVSVWNDY